MELTHNIIVYILPIVSLIMTFCWTILNVRKKYLRIFSLIMSALVTAFMLLSVFLNGFTRSFYFIAEATIFYPIIFAWISLFGTIIIYKFNNKEKNSFSVILFGLNLLLLLFGLELLKVSINTWKSFLPMIALLYILFAIVILQVFTYLHQANFGYGILKLIAGIISFIIIILQFLDLLPPISFGSSITFENGSVFISTILMIEGLLLIYKVRKDRYLKDNEMV